MFNLSYAAYDYEYDLFLTTSHSNLTQWQREQIQDLPDEGKQCMIGFWSSPPPQGILGLSSRICPSFHVMNYIPQTALTLTAKCKFFYEKLALGNVPLYLSVFTGDCFQVNISMHRGICLFIYLIIYLQTTIIMQ